jgi:hypothetical protein
VSADDASWIACVAIMAEVELGGHQIVFTRCSDAVVEDIDAPIVGICSGVGHGEELVRE